MAHSGSEDRLLAAVALPIALRVALPVDGPLLHQELEVPETCNLDAHPLVADQPAGGVSPAQCGVIDLAPPVPGRFWQARQAPSDPPRRIETCLIRRRYEPEREQLCIVGPPLAHGFVDVPQTVEQAPERLLLLDGNFLGDVAQHEVRRVERRRVVECLGRPALNGLAEELWVIKPGSLTYMQECINSLEEQVSYKLLEEVKADQRGTINALNNYLP